MFDKVSRAKDYECIEVEGSRDLRTGYFCILKYDYNCIRYQNIKITITFGVHTPLVQTRNLRVSKQWQNPDFKNNL